MSRNVGPEQRSLRFSLRFLFVVMTAAAVGFALGVPFGDWLKPLDHGYAPDQAEFWLKHFYQGDEHQRQTAIGVISVRVRNDVSDERLVKALCEAALDDDRYIRLHFIAGLERAAGSNRDARAVLERLAADDSDSHVAEMARAALTMGVTSANQGPQE